MGVRYSRCDPGDCCKDERYGASSDPPESRGRLLTKASRDECSNKGKTSDGSSCECRWVKHYSKFIKDGDSNKRDTGWVVSNETVYDGKNPRRWSDKDEADLQAEKKKMDATTEKVEILPLCLALDSDNKPIPKDI
jgi:hypothetical protein